MSSIVQQARGAMESLYSASDNSSFSGLNAPKAAQLSFLQNPAVGIAICAVLFVVALVNVFGGKKNKLPPGVKPLPMQTSLPYAGRFWDVPEEGIAAAWHFGGLHKKLGPIYQWKVMGTIHVWIETDEISRDLFVKRQRIYCDRNELPAAIGVREGKEVLPLMGYGDAWKRYKNFMHYIMKHSGPQSFYGWPAQENKKTLRRLLESPDRWSEHMLTHCARTIASVAWGDPEHGKKLLTIVPELLKAVSPAGPLINKLTFLMNLPWQLSPWKVAETRRKREMTEAFYEALDDVQRRVDDGSAEMCWSMLWLTSNKGTEAKKLDYHEAAHAIGSSSFVAIATIGGPLHAFFLAVCRYPEWLPKLQEEIDTVCGDRLPQLEDMPNMPRLRATVKEMLRWRQSTPLGVPHSVLQDDVYNGYFIPKGAICHANNFLISREPSMFPNGEHFIPERWLEPSYPTYKEPLTEYPNIRGDIAFGYGNRACPGVDLTHLELFTLYGALASVFDIKAKGPIEDLPWYEVNPYVITMTSPFPIDLKARSEAKRKFIMDGCPDPGYTLTDEKQTRWDVTHDPTGRPYTWQEVSVPYVAPEKKKVYPEILDGVRV